ncbi:MAG TPA: hypothetical protein VGM98_16825 [Schlesneria sp.]
MITAVALFIAGLLFSCGGGSGNYNGPPPPETPEQREWRRSRMSPAPPKH